MKKPVKIGFLGGVGQFGMNLTFYEDQQYGFMIDCGSGFGANYPGVDSLYPDFTYLKEHEDKFKYLILSHGHEDHIGAVKRLLKVIQPEIWAMPFTIELLKQKVPVEHHHLFKEIVFDEDQQYGSFSFKFIPIEHSIIGSFLTVIHHDGKQIVHTSDFKEADDFKLLMEKLEGQRVDCLLLDSTNSDQKKDGGSEEEVTNYLYDRVAGANSRVFITMFASNVERVKAIMDVAKQLNRSLVLMGRSLHRFQEIGKAVGYFDDQSMIIDIKEYRKYPHDQVIFLVTGSQGEQYSAMDNLIFDQYQHIRFEPEDLLIFSSKVIPGNETRVYKMVNDAMEKGIEVAFNEPGAHSSGHANRDTLKEMIAGIKPRFFIPIHGDYRHLYLCQELAFEEGVEEDRSVLPANGDVYTLTDELLYLEERVPAEPNMVDYTGLEPFNPILLKEREQLQYGVVIITVIFDQDTFETVVPPTVINRGFFFEEDHESFLNKLVEIVGKVVDEADQETKRDYKTLSQEIKRALRRYLRRKVRNQPLFLPIIQYI